MRPPPGLLLIAASLALAAGLWVALGSGPGPGEEGTSESDAATEGEASGSVPLLAGVGSPQPPSDADVPDEEEPPPLAEGDVLATGRVTDERRRPVPGAVVTAMREARIVGRARSDRDGRFRLRVGPLPAAGAPPSWVAVVGRKGTDRVGWGRLYLTAATRGDPDMGPLVLREGVSLGVRVTAAGVPVAGAQVLLTLPLLARGVPVLERATGPSGLAAIPSFPKGVIRLVAWHPQHGRGDRLVGLSLPSRDPVEVALTPHRTLHVRVVDEQGTPVEGARIRVLEALHPREEPGEREPYLPTPVSDRTDPEGRIQWLVGAGDTVVVSSRPPEGSDVPGWPSQRVPPERTDVRIVVPAALQSPPETVLRWRLVDGEVPVPPEGSVVHLEAAMGSALPPGSVARVRDRHLVVEVGRGLWLGATALLTDGSWATLRTAGVPEVVSFARPRSLEVRVQDEDGSPVAGLEIRVGRAYGSPEAPTAVTGEDGRAALAPIRAVAVKLEAGPKTGSLPLGVVQLPEGTTSTAFTIPSDRTWVFRFRCRGEALLPASLLLHSTPPLHVIAEDPEAGELRATARPPRGIQSLRVWVRAHGFVPVEVQAEPRVPTEVDLTPAGTILLDLSPPSDDTLSIEVLPEDPATGTWPRGRVFPEPLRPVDVGPVRIEPLAAGRYLVLDRASCASVEVTVPAGAPEVPARLDLSRAGWVRGTVLVPPGEDAAAARVVVTGPGLHVAGVAPLVTYADGFSARIPGDRPVTLTASHPTLSPDPREGTLTLETPRAGVVLRLVRGRTASLEVLPPEGSAGDRFRTARVRLLRAGLSQPVLAVDGHVSAGREVTFAGFEPGRYDVWVDLGAYAPVVFPAVDLGEGANRLGSMAASQGSSLRLEVLLPPERRRTGYQVTAEHLGEPAYRRVVYGGSGEVVLPGLGPGRFRVRATITTEPPDSGGRKPADWIVQADGVRDVVETLDLR